MFIQFNQTGDLASFQDILPRNLFRKAKTFREDLSIFFFGLTESEISFLKVLGARFQAQIYQEGPGQ